MVQIRQKARWISLHNGAIDLQRIGEGEKTLATLRCPFFQPPPFPLLVHLALSYSLPALRHPYR
ncbi:hypothetical protein SCATT_25150 [Streptantibioticus cattleyicolor NRRL 8057 = DSM 46488]|uniref:Uncharacterized protein n=1 Tax=Streptantibioticus cattleyicolor (strain ATCC 35852 / DSM 46488 / JCM 4925 / NBRC 14057 / NRRL 8057) TaxID=1003195 RepID=G8WU64_STREN|nr:hypothetical protein SCATT_25150 [Streptantibioticus cattleyicolor NRRL 8057 = DSM 46488]